MNLDDCGAPEKGSVGGRRSAMTTGRRRGIFWVTRDNSAPHPSLVQACRRAGSEVRELHWAEEFEGEQPIGRFVELGRGTGRKHPMSVKLVSPRLLARFTRATEDVAIFYELGLVGLYAGVSTLVRRRGLISLVEGDYRHLGRTGTAGAKVALRRLAARRVDLFIANSPPARDYLVETLKVPRSRIVTGWWLAGLPDELPARVPSAAPPAPAGEPLFVCAGRLIAPKGIDLLIEAVAVHRRETGACTVWIIGDGPERERLTELARLLGVEDSVIFLGTVDPGELKGALELCDALVFPTLQDLVGRVVVEALTVGVPVVLSPMTGAAGTVVRDGVNGLIVDPRDPRALAGALARFAEPRTRTTLRAGARDSSAMLAPDAVAALILRAVALVRERRGTPTSRTAARGG
jgi:glycosyltransferase involved in cell wall biosynthesis